MITNWYGQRFRKLHLDWHQPPWMSGVGSALTPEASSEMVQRFAEAHVEAVEVFAHDHHGYAFFPNPCVGRAHPHLVGDPVQTMVGALKAGGLSAIAYMNVYSNIYLHEAHPDWTIVTPDGTAPSGAWLQFPASQMCPSSPYLDEYFLPLLTQVLERYPFDAVWLDGGSWLGNTLCHCTRCASSFYADTGHELPTAWPVPALRASAVPRWSWQAAPIKQQWTLADEDPDDESWFTWRTWRLNQVWEYLQRTIAAAKKVRPDVLLADNNVGRWSMPLARRIDGDVEWLTPSEAGLDYLSCDPVPNGGNHAVVLSHEGRYQSTTGMPFDYMNVRANRWGEWQLRAVNDFELEFATIMAVGATCFFADQPYPDGSVEPAVYDSLAASYRFVERREDYARNTTPVEDVAILASAPSQLFGPRGGGGNPRREEHSLVGSRRGERTDRVEGAHLIAIEAGLHCLLFDEKTLRSNIAEQSAVVVAEQCLLESATLNALHDYVISGGSLLVTGRSGWWDEIAQRRPEAEIADLLGVEVLGVYPEPLAYLVAGQHLRESRGLIDVPVQCWGRAVRIAARDADVIATLRLPRPEVWRDGITDQAHWRHYTTVGACPPADVDTGPGVTLRKLGRGQVLYVATDPFAVYRHEGSHLIRELLNALLDIAVPIERRKVHVRNRPFGVEVALRRQGSRLVVHLLNYFAQKSSERMVQNEQLVTLKDLEVSIRCGRPNSVRAEPDGTKLEWQLQDRVVLVRLPELRTHKMIILDGV